MPPGGPGWLHELKLDGVRFQVVKGGSQVRLYGRSGAEWTKRLPGFAAAFLDLRCRSLDGELVLPEEDGAPDSLQSVVSEAQEHELASSPSICCTATAPIFGHCPSPNAGAACCD